MSHSRKQQDPRGGSEPPGGSDAPALTSNQGVKISNTDSTLTAGTGGPQLLEDHLAREKIQHFDHERIPERVVHARGSAAHGYFECTHPAADITKASLFAAAGKRTPVFVRFSTVQGARGSNDLVRDVRGFAIKFQTENGVWDLVGNDIPVFFVQDATKFPDFVHAVKPEPHHDMPQGASAHDSFWDFCSLATETAHMLMWVMSPRGTPASLATIEGFGVNTFKFVSADGEARLVKFHFKPHAGLASMTWDETVKGAGRDGDLHRRQLWERLNGGGTIAWTMGVQVLPDAETCLRDWGINPLDATKIVPEEMVPVRELGTLVLNRNPDNFFAETEQVAFCPTHVVPGIDFSDDPLLQGRLFSYPDTQLTRLGPNFAQLPINAPHCPMMNNTRDGKMCLRAQRGRVNYFPSARDNAAVSAAAAAVASAAGAAGVCPVTGQSGSLPPIPQPNDPQAFSTAPQPMPEGAVKIRERPPSFQDHFSQARLFWRSLSEWERAHTVAAFTFELGNVTSTEIRSNVVHRVLCRIDDVLARAVAARIGVHIDEERARAPMQRLPGAGPNTEAAAPGSEAAEAAARAEKACPRSEALSMDRPPPTLDGRTVGAVVGDGASARQLSSLRAAVADAGMRLQVITETAMPVTLAGGAKGSHGHSQAQCEIASANINPTALASVFVVAGSEAWAGKCRRVKQLISDHFEHGKAVCDATAGAAALRNAGVPAEAEGRSNGIITAASLASDDGGDDGGGAAGGADSEEALVRAFVAANWATNRYYQRQTETLAGNPNKEK